MVMSLHREIERSINIDVESSSRDDDVTIITNLSSVEASYTVVQGKKIHSDSVVKNELLNARKVATHECCIKMNT